jgi:hypothetical protein
LHEPIRRKDVRASRRRDPIEANQARRIEMEIAALRQATCTVDASERLPSPVRNPDGSPPALRGTIPDSRPTRRRAKPAPLPGRILSAYRRVELSRQHPGMEALMMTKDEAEIQIVHISIDTCLNIYFENNILIHVDKFHCSLKIKLPIAVKMKHTE